MHVCSFSVLQKTKQQQQKNMYPGGDEMLSCLATSLLRAVLALTCSGVIANITDKFKCNSDILFIADLF